MNDPDFCIPRCSTLFYLFRFWSEDYITNPRLPETLFFNFGWRNWVQSEANSNKLRFKLSGSWLLIWKYKVKNLVPPNSAISPRPSLFLEANSLKMKNFIRQVFAKNNLDLFNSHFIEKNATKKTKKLEIAVLKSKTCR